MRFLMVFIAFVAFLHTASAFPYSAPFFLDSRELPSCVRTCSVLSETIKSCSALKSLASNDATYIDCLCRSEGLRSLYDGGELCHDHCSRKEELAIKSSYSSLCIKPHVSVTPSTTPSSAPVPTPTSSPHIASTTFTSSTSITQPTQTSEPGTEELRMEHASSQPWIKKNWKYVLAGVLLLIAVLAVAVSALLYAQRRRRQRPLSDAERYAAMERALQERLEENYGPRARGQIIPLKTLNSNKGIRGRLSRMPLSRTPVRDPIINRRQRRRDPSVGTLAPLNRPLPSAVQGTWTPQRPASARTTASSIGQRSVSSPLVPISRDMLRNISHAQSLRHYAEEQAERERDLDIIRSISSGNLRRTDGFYGGQ